MRMWRIKYHQAGTLAETYDRIFHDGMDEPTLEQAAQILRNRLFPDVYPITDTLRNIQEKTVRQLEQQGITIVEVSEYFRYHATVHDDDGRQVFECHILGEDSGNAREVLNAYFRNQGMPEFVGMTIALIEYRVDIESDLPLIQ